MNIRYIIGMLFLVGAALALSIFLSHNWLKHFLGRDDVEMKQTQTLNDKIKALISVIYAHFFDIIVVGAMCCIIITIIVFYFIVPLLQHLQIIT